MSEQDKIIREEGPLPPEVPMFVYENEGIWVDEYVPVIPPEIIKRWLSRKR